jgi:dienelactone hydrolase
VLLAALLALAAAAAVVPRYARAAGLVILAAGVDGWPHRLASAGAGAFRVEERTVPGRSGALRGRLYLPSGRPRRALLLAPGVHAAGLDEPRLGDFAGHLASRGYAVLAVELPDLVHYHVTARTADMIEDAAVWLAGASGLAADGRVGLAGISFAGGLAVVAAGRPALRDRVAFVLSVGGYGDLPRTLRYLCTGALADGTVRAPHDYGLAIVLLALAGAVAPAEQAEALRDGILTFLEASQTDAVDKARAASLFERAREKERALPEPAATLLGLVNRRRVADLGRILLPHLDGVATDPALSPERSPAPAAPVFLLHGAADNVIPSLESRLLARHLEGKVHVELLVSASLTHAEARPAGSLREAWKMVGFWASLLDQ